MSSRSRSTRSACCATELPTKPDADQRDDGLRAAAAQDSLGNGGAVHRSHADRLLLRPPAAGHITAPPALGSAQIPRHDVLSILRLMVRFATKVPPEPSSSP